MVSLDSQSIDDVHRALEELFLPKREELDFDLQVETGVDIERAEEFGNVRHPREYR